MARLSRFTTKARRRAGRQHAVAVAAVVGPSAVDLTQAVVEQVGDLGWRVSVDSKTLACGLASREAAEAYLANLERIRTTPMANDELDRLRGDVAGTKTKDAALIHASPSCVRRSPTSSSWRTAATRTTRPNTESVNPSCAI